MTKTAVIFGAGSGLGTAIARKFGQQGYRVALVARRQARLDALAETLRAEGIETGTYRLDLDRPEDVAPAIERMRSELGPIGAVYYGPNAVVDFVPAFALTSDAIAASLRLFVTSMIAAIHASLPDLRAAGTGTIIVGLGGSARFAVPFMSGPGPGMAAARNYLTSLHGELKAENIQVVMLTLTAVIKHSAWQEKLETGEIKFDLPPGIVIPEIEPETLADWLFAAAANGTPELIYPEQPPAN